MPPFSLSNLTWPSWMRSSRTRLICLPILALALLLWATLYLTRWYDPRGRPHFKLPYQRDRWLDIAPLTHEVNITQMLLDSPGQWYMFQSPVPELMRAPPPQTYSCSDTNTFGPMVFLGVFTIASEQSQRAVIRALQKLDSLPSETVVTKFIMGRSPDEKLQRWAETEAEMYGDIVFLDIEENMDSGKTYAYFKWVASLGEGQRPRFVLKADSDAFLVLPNVLHSFSHLSCSQLVYWGTAWGSCIDWCYPFYMRGLAYGLSWPLVSWLAHADLPATATGGTEDIRTGAWFANLPPNSPPLTVVDLHTHSGDWDGLTTLWDLDTVVLHRMKEPSRWVRVANLLMEMWDKEGREWRWPPRKDRDGTGGQGEGRDLQIEVPR